MSSRALREKLDHIFWWLIWLLPLIGALVCLFNGSHTAADFTSFIDGFSFSFVADIWADIEDLISITFPSVLRSYASFIVSVEIVHVFVDVMIFIPRFCHKVVNLDTYVDIEDCRRKK